VIVVFFFQPLSEIQDFSTDGGMKTNGSDLLPFIR